MRLLAIIGIVLVFSCCFTFLVAAFLRGAKHFEDEDWRP